MIRNLLLCLTCFATCLTAQQSFAQSNAVKVALPAIICLLICEEEPATSPPALENIVGTITYFNDEAAGAVAFSNAGGREITSCIASPSLPAGLTAQVSGSGFSCEIVGTPTIEIAAAVFTITATNPIGSSDASVTLEVLASKIVLSGTLTYDLVPTTNVGGVRLDYDNITQEPVRAVTVQLLDDTGALLQSTSSNNLGQYSFTLSSDSLVRIRVRAELLKTTGNGQYNVRVEDNTNNNALYTLAETAASSARDNLTRDLHAASGWGGSSYTSIRASAPFAMLDSIFHAIEDVLGVDSDAVFPPLIVNWSVDNRPTGGNLSAGFLGTSFYMDGNLFILGAANVDTDEFDDHIIIHEWGHYFEDKLSRSDSIGGPHSGGDSLDMRVAFGEGFGNALSGIVTDDPLYIDTGGFNQANGFTINVESNPTFNRGWFNESSVQSILYDLYDADDDGNDVISLGLAPLYEVLVNQQRATPFFTSIFTFISALKSDLPASATLIDQLVSAQNIVSNTIDEQGSNETNNAGDALHVLPVYTTLTLGNTTNLCTNTSFNGSGNNKLANHRYLEFTISNAGSYDFTVARTSASNGYGNSDPDFEVFQDGIFRFRGFSGVVNTENASANLLAGQHVMALTDFAISSPGARGVACFDIDIVAAPAPN